MEDRSGRGLERSRRTWTEVGMTKFDEDVDFSKGPGGSRQGMLVSGRGVAQTYSLSHTSRVSI